MNYVSARTLYKIINNEQPKAVYDKLVAQTVYETRNLKLYFTSTNKRRVGKNAFENRCDYVSKRLSQVDWASEWAVFKKLIKKEFL